MIPLQEHSHDNSCMSMWIVGEYIAVEKVEAVFKKNSNLEQIWVYGNSYEAVLVAVVVPNEVQPCSAFQDLKLLVPHAGCRTPCAV
jgi:hypothetical protein